MKRFYEMIARLFDRMGYTLWVVKKEKDERYSIITPMIRYVPWVNDEDFLDVVQKIKGYTMVSFYRLFGLWQLTEMAAKLDEGALLEVGTWKGGSSALIGRKALLSGIKEKLYLCDTFTGVVKVSASDPDYSEGEHNDASEADLLKVLEINQVKNFSICKGIFPDETASKIDAEKFRLCHIDVDIYDSAKDIFEWVWPKMVPGGIVVFDDYASRRCIGVSNLVDKLSKKDDLIFVYNLNGQGVFIKR